MRLRGLITACCLALVLSAAPAGADLLFSSTFDGAAPWNWDTTVGTPAGTGAMTVPVGPSAGRNYVQQAISNTQGDGTGTLKVSFEVDLSEMAFDGWYSGPRIFEVGSSVGNKSALGDGMMAGISVANWKADSGVGSEFRFNVASAINFWGGAGSVSAVFNPTESFVYDLDLTVDVTRVDDTWTVLSTLVITGDSGGSIVTRDVAHSFSYTTTGFQGLLHANRYRLGVLNTSTTIDGTSMTFDNFSAVPEPASLALLAMGGLGLIRRRR